jgi:type VI secretion system protein VasG
LSLNLKSLIGKLTSTSRRGLEAAAGLAVSRTHYEVEMEHWIGRLAEPSAGDVSRIVRHFDVHPDRFLQDIAEALARFKTGSGSRPDLTESIEEIARDGWMIASVNRGEARVRSGVLFLAVLRNPVLRRRLVEVSPGVESISADALEKDLDEIVAGSPEDREVTTGAPTAERDLSGRAAAGAPGGATPGLDQYTVDLTESARQGRIDPVLGRDSEIRQIVDILMRRRQNNPILTGEAGVGKTAVVEGFALRITEGDIPEPLRGVSLRTLDLGLLQAGAGVKGEFENRLKQVIEEVQSSPTPIILFIDEAHTMIGAGGQEGQSDAANLLKPALARGELRTIAATTWAEYKKYFEKDPALTRRFQVIKIEEPDEGPAIEMMRGVAPKLESHHAVRILDEAVRDSVRLSRRYIPARQLPDKSVSVLDTACARVSIGHAATPAPLEDLRRRMEGLEHEQDILTRESAVGVDHAERLEEIAADLAETGKRRSELEERWKKEKELVKAMADIRTRLEEGKTEGTGGGEADVAPDDEAAATPATLSDDERRELRADLDRHREELERVQGDVPLVQTEVDGQTVAAVISEWTGIPVGRMVADEIQTVLELPERLKERVVGQDHALEAIGQRIRTARAKMDNPSKPVGVFLLVGPSGVGKTESALALSEALFGGERNMVSINMSEYQEAHTVSSLKGSPPGYVGYGEGGVLTEAVRRRPYSVVLLDEVEKAHPDVMELFFQVFDKGVLEDGEGREVDFKNTILLLTSNVGSDTIMKLCADPDTIPEPEGLAGAIRPELLQAFPAALLGRMIVTPFYPLGDEVMKKIIRLQMSRIVHRIQENHAAVLEYDDELVQAVADRCTESASGARNIDAILTRSILPAVSTEILERMARAEPFQRVRVTVGDSGDFLYEIT